MGDADENTIRKSKIENRKSPQGFSLLELLVAAAVFAVILSLVLALTSSTAGVTGTSARRIEAEAGLRGALDRMFADFSAAVVRADLPPHFVKLAGNDEMYFYARADGYKGDRGLSVIGYRIRGKGLERGAQGSGWESDRVVFSQDLAGALTALETSGSYDTLESGVFRLETEYLLRDGSVVKGPPTADWEEISAVVVNLASIDERSLLKAKGTLAELAALFPDAEDGQRVMAAWREKLDDPVFLQGNEAFPTAALSGLRVRQRVLPVRR